jgi:serine/threonine protein kinase
MDAVLDRTENQIHKGAYFGPFRLLSPLKKGGMSSVYLGYDLRTGQRVAIKLVSNYSPHLAYFYRERQIMQSLRHDSIIPCLGAGRCGMYYYLAMPYVGNRTLEDLIEEQPLTLEEADIVLEQITSALAYIHSRGVFHRDIKPSNILFDGADRFYLADFGIASRRGEKVLHNGHVMGTAQYIAPEIFDGQLDERSEVYAVGILLYQMLTGHLPFDGENQWKICVQHKEEKPLFPSFYTPSLPRSVEQVILRALEKEPRRRFQTMEELYGAYQKALRPSFSNQLATSLRQVGQRVRLQLAPETGPWDAITAGQPALQA